MAGERAFSDWDRFNLIALAAALGASVVGVGVIVVAIVALENDPHGSTEGPPLPVLVVQQDNPQVQKQIAWQSEQQNEAQFRREARQESAWRAKMRAKWVKPGRAPVYVRPGSLRHPFWSPSEWTRDVEKFEAVGMTRSEAEVLQRVIADYSEEQAIKKYQSP